MPEGQIYLGWNLMNILWHPDRFRMGYTEARAQWQQQWHLKLVPLCETSGYLAGYLAIPKLLLIHFNHVSGCRNGAPILDFIWGIQLNPGSRKVTGRPLRPFLALVYSYTLSQAFR